MDEIKEKIKKLKKIKIIIMIIGVLFFALVIIAALIAIIPGAMNGIQSVGDNSSSPSIQGQTGYETGKNSLFSTLCQDCESASDNTKNGVLSSEFYQKMSEMMNLYNSLEYEEERVDEFDFELLSATIQYGKIFKSELFTDSDEFGSWYDEKGLTNRDIDSFYGITDINKDNAQEFFKWAAVMLGTPYSLPDINLRGLSGSLITGRVTTECVAGGSIPSEEDQEKELIDQIVSVEKKLSGEIVSTPNFWDSILSFLGLSYITDDNLLKERLEAMFDDESKYEDLKPFVNLDNFDMNACTNGYSPKHTYTKFMNYDQYKVYLEKVFIPQNYINCETCVWKDASEYNKKIKIQDIMTEIFKKAEYFHTYAGMSNFSYDNITYGQTIDGNDLSFFTSPIKNKCAVTSPYGYRGGVLHSGVDTKITSSDKSLYAIADGIVQIVDTRVTENIYETNKSCAKADDIRNNGVYIVIKHEINGKVYYTQYGHLSKDGIEVKVGDTVKQGDKIAVMGNTGCSTGPHLHFDLYLGSYSEDAEKINPTVLFRQCDNSGMSGRLKLTTTDNYVYPEKCMVGNYTLDEVITSMIKSKDSNAFAQKEYVKATAIVMRTMLMEESEWCNKKINANVKIDIENNPIDLSLYNQVIETQGMVLNYSGETIDNASYASFPCNYLPRNDWYNHKALVLPIIGMTEEEANKDSGEVIRRIDSYNIKNCVQYQINGDLVTVDLSTIPSAVVKNKSLGIDNPVRFESIPKSMITSTEKGAQKKFSLIIAKSLASKGKDYTEILYQFYQAKAINQEDLSVNHGVVDISTAPGLIDAKKKVSNMLGNNSQGFTYGETLPGSNNIPDGKMSEEELQTINNHLKDYVDRAEQNAIAAGDINPKRVRVMAAAYWLINNPFYKVQYGWGRLSQPDVDGWNPEWNSKIGVECSGFVIWSLRQAGAYSYYPTASALQHSPTFLAHRGVNFTVQELLDAGIEPGDVLRKSMVTDGSGNRTGNGHWSIVMTVNYEERYIEVAHATNEAVDTTISRYNYGETISYQFLYKLPAFYQDEAWKASVGK